MGTTNFYAHVIHDGKTTELAVAADGILNVSWKGLKGTLISNATVVDCSDNSLTSLSLPNATWVYCSYNSLISLSLPNATWVYCEDNSLTSLELPNAKKVICRHNSLTALVKDCGSSSRQIWSQKIGDTIYTHIGCGRFTLDEAIVAINKKYSGAEAEEYIAKVKQSQEAVTN